ncbi:Hypothetical protein FKW44_013953 [Caligus rogercresseyi]|uniref:Uncharacterized protein n=1 Tax=Caligus rogercresseyi TaxID=217165 RepID=A0A7T8JYN9_CALRO|nr:Hypothetical protein FKW44_013953 [Caligus rogercresseyi]
MSSSNLQDYIYTKDRILMEASVLPGLTPSLRRYDLAYIATTDHQERSSTFDVPLEDRQVLGVLFLFTFGCAEI